jgi:hypothetical protein
MMIQGKREAGRATSSGAQNRAGNADNISPTASAPSFATRRSLLFVHAHVIPERPRVSIGACDVRTEARWVLLKSERGGNLGRVRRENAQGAGGGAEETRGETAAAVGGEYAESEHVHLDRGQWSRARGQIRGEDVQGSCYAGDGLV